MKIRMVLGMIILLGLFIAAACTGKPAPTPAPTPTPNPAEQRKELFEKLADAEKDGYDTSTFLFDLRGQEAYDQLVSLANGLGKELAAGFFNKEDELLGSIPLLGFSFGGKMTIPDPWTLFAGALPPPEDFKGFQIVAVPEQIPVGGDKAPFIDQRYGLYTFGVPPGLGKTVISSFPRGNFMKLKPLDVVLVGNGEGNFTSGQVLNAQEISNGLAFISYEGFVYGGGIAFVLKNGLPEIIGIILGVEDNIAAILDIDIVLNQKSAP